MKRISRSKLQRRPRPAGVELGVVGVAVGAGCGMLGGLMIEFNSRPSALVMFVGALIGMTGGGLVELVRFLGRKHAHRKIAHRDATAGQVPAPRFLSTAPPIMKLIALLFGLILPATAFAHAMTSADQQAALDGGNLEYLKLGATHMLTGYDHLLFLFGVMFFLTRFADIVKFITAFTVGHCITLVFATLLHIKANYFLVDAVIALTVCYKAFDNLDGFRKWIDAQPPSLLGAVFLFGLIHGFGLSTRLQQLPLGHDGLVLRILSFNVGVEVGQILALGVMGLVLNSWRKTASFVKFAKVANVALMVAGALLLLMQLHGYQHSQFPEDFPLNKDEHFHVHEDMASPGHHKK